jgi:hypothetical protein
MEGGGIDTESARDCIVNTCVNLGRLLLPAADESVSVAASIAVLFALSQLA